MSAPYELVPDTWSRWLLKCTPLLTDQCGVEGCDRTSRAMVALGRDPDPYSQPTHVVLLCHEHVQVYAAYCGDPALLGKKLPWRMLGQKIEG